MRLNIRERLGDFIHKQAVVARNRLDFQYGCDDLGQDEGDVEKRVPPVVGPAMKAHDFEYGCDDLGQYEGDVERQVPPVAAATQETPRYVH